MRCYKGFVFYRDRVYPTLHAALLAVWPREVTSYEKSRPK